LAGGSGGVGADDVPAATSDNAITGETAASRPMVLLDKISPGGPEDRQMFRPT
jgi:hypothetical protein